MLAEKSQYLTAGIHIGMKTCTPYMKKFIYKVREDGLAVFNLKMVDERLKTAAEFLSVFDTVIAVSRKESGQRAVQAFARALGTHGVAGRFTPGTLTNPHFRGFQEPEAVIVVDPLIDSQVVNEAKRKRIPIVALCDTFNMAKDIDLVIPANNNGRKSLALIFWILSREILKNKGTLKKDSDFKFTLDEFGDVPKEEVMEEPEQPVGLKRQPPKEKTRRRE